MFRAIYEQDFLRCSYGYRPDVGALDAVDWLTVKLQFGQYHWVVESALYFVAQLVGCHRQSNGP